MKIRAIIIDDEPLAHTIIEKYEEDIPYLEIVGHCYKATEAFQMLKAKAIDLLFLDIQMPKLTGLEFLRTLDRKPFVIITSAHSEYALEGFELNVSDYLLKPFRFERFLKAVNKVQDLISLNKEEVNFTTASGEKPSSSEKTLFLKVDKKVVRVLTKNIFYLESYGNYVKCWLENEYILTPRTLTSMEEELVGSSFIRIHKSTLINKHTIHYLEGNRVVLKNGKSLPIGKTYSQTVKSHFI
ncbi:response regulator transcription factor [Marivirga sp. S37H4]|uniref:Response regulator transcription factor n=1 Tax=Marivirga aurantiaca TaxID=2802615 RepID=A0A934X029_9BACT|nr:response regulator transcription factor [Marivirga aurantiaca]MBK6265965.1 response regulator transcription factor [Marivirga aurantiaca]